MPNAKASPYPTLRQAGRIGIPLCYAGQGPSMAFFPATAGNGPLDNVNLTTIGRFRNQGQLSNSGKNEGPAARVDGRRKCWGGFAPGRSRMSRQMGAIRAFDRRRSEEQKFAKIVATARARSKE